MSISEITNRVHSLGSAWEQFKQVNDARLNEIERKGNADGLYTEHLAKISHALDQHKSRLDGIEVANNRPGFELAMEQKSSHAEPSEYKKAFCNYLRKGMDAGLEHLQTKALNTRTSSGIDRQGYNGLLVAVAIGAALDTLNGSIYWTIKLQHSDDNSSYADVTADDVQGGVVSYVVNSMSLDETTYKYAYKGIKRYVRVVCTHTGSHINGTPMCVTAIKSNPAIAPVA